MGGLGSPISIGIFAGMCLILFTGFSTVFNSQTPITNGYIQNTSYQYDEVGILPDLGILDYIYGVANIETGLPIFDGLWKAILLILIILSVAYYLA